MIFISWLDRVFSMFKVLILKLKDFAYVAFKAQPKLVYGHCRTFAILKKVKKILPRNSL